MPRRLLTSLIAATLTLCRTDLRAEPQQGVEVTTVIKDAYTAANALLSAPQICRESGVEFLVKPAESGKLATCKEIATAFVKSLDATAKIAADEVNGSIAPAIYAMLLQSHRSATWGLGPLVKRNDIEGGEFFVPESSTEHGHSRNDPAFLFNILEKKLKEAAPSIAGVSNPAFEGRSTDRSLADSDTLTQIENLWAKADAAVTWYSAVSANGSDANHQVEQSRTFAQCAALVSLNAAITAWNRATQRVQKVSELYSKRADSVEAKLRESLARWVRVAAIHNTTAADNAKDIEKWTLKQAWALHIAPTNLDIDSDLSLEVLRDKAGSPKAAVGAEAQCRHSRA